MMHFPSDCQGRRHFLHDAPTHPSLPATLSFPVWFPLANMFTSSSEPWSAQRGDAHILIRLPFSFLAQETRMSG